MSREYNYTEEFKVQIAKLRESGKPISAIVKEYGIAKSTISKWHHDYANSGSFKASDNISAGDKELKLLLCAQNAKSMRQVLEAVKNVYFYLNGFIMPFYRCYNLIKTVKAIVFCK